MTNLLRLFKLYKSSNRPRMKIDNVEINIIDILDTCSDSNKKTKE